MSIAVTHMSVLGMNCGNCARHVAQAIQAVPGVQSATVNLEAHNASVRWREGIDPAVMAVIEAVENAGYTAKEIVPEAREADVPAHDHGAHKLAGWQSNLWLGVLGTLPLMLGEWVFGLDAAPWSTRARSELRATGERVSPRKPALTEQLTPQERQVAVLAASNDGHVARDGKAAPFAVGPKHHEYGLHAL